MSQQHHRSDARLLDRRTLEHDHRRLARRLRPGMAVLDVGCGTGAITAGIAHAVGRSGEVLGIDRDEALLASARQKHQGISQLSFDTGDALALEYDERFDIVTAARTLQWISEPEVAIKRMIRALKPGGLLMILDYNHRDNTWNPKPPEAFQRFYTAFLEWRSANRWSNHMGDEMPGLFRSAGLTDIQTHIEDQTDGRGEGTWGHVIESLGPIMVEAGFLTDSERLSATTAYDDYVRNRLDQHKLSLRCTEGFRSRS